MKSDITRPNPALTSTPLQRDAARAFIERAGRLPPSAHLCPLHRVRLSPAGQDDRQQVLYLAPAYVALLVTVEVLGSLTTATAPYLGPASFGAVFLLLVLHAILCWERPFRHLPLALAATPALRVALALATAHPPVVLRGLALGLPIALAAVVALRILRLLPSWHDIAGQAGRSREKVAALFHYGVLALQHRFAPFGFVLLTLPALTLLLAILAGLLIAHSCGAPVTAAGLTDSGRILAKSSLPAASYRASVEARPHLAPEEAGIQSDANRQTGTRPAPGGSLLHRIVQQFAVVPSRRTPAGPHRVPNLRTEAKQALATWGQEQRAAADSPARVSLLEATHRVARRALGTLRAPAMPQETAGPTKRPEAATHLHPVATGGLTLQETAKQAWDTVLGTLIVASNGTWSARPSEAQLAEEQAPAPPAKVPPPKPPSRQLSTNCPSSGYDNPYPRAVCTWYAKERRPDLPGFWGDYGLAVNWPYAAAACGFRVDGVPEVGAVIVFPPGANGAYEGGHVGYVEAVEPDALLVSECNVDHDSAGIVEPLWWDSGYACAFRRIPWERLNPQVQFIHR